jgi:hypothetical protein
MLSRCVECARERVCFCVGSIGVSAQYEMEVRSAVDRSGSVCVCVRHSSLNFFMNLQM